MNVWQAAVNKYHLKLNLLKTEVMMLGQSHQTLNIKIGAHTLNQVQSFKYLGSTVNEQSTQEEEIKNRIVKYSQNVGCMYRLLKDRNAPKKSMQSIHQRGHFKCYVTPWGWVGDSQLSQKKTLRRCTVQRLKY